MELLKQLKSYYIEATFELTSVFETLHAVGNHIKRPIETRNPSFVLSLCAKFNFNRTSMKKNITSKVNFQVYTCQCFKKVVKDEKVALLQFFSWTIPLKQRKWKFVLLICNDTQQTRQMILQFLSIFNCAASLS